MAKLVWPIISDLVGAQVGTDFESVARWWLSNNKNTALNVVCGVVLWAIWKLRNEMCFQGKVWPGVRDIWRRVVVELHLWKVLSKDAVSKLLARNIFFLNKMSGELLRIAWR